MCDVYLGKLMTYQHTIQCPLTTATATAAAAAAATATATATTTTTTKSSLRQNVYSLP